MLKLKIPKTIFEQILEQARMEAPIEACGILAGKNRKVEKFYPMTNTENSSNHFMMEPKEQFAVVKDIRAAGLEMLSIFHSHPESPACPSAEDIKLALTPDVIYVIVSLHESGNPVINGFLINDGSIKKVPVEILEDQE
jgi:proteasome lid subunit RPN8/RPN11